MNSDQLEKSAVSIGFFLGHNARLELDRQGFGRFVLRLAEGFLSNQTDTSIYVTTTEENYQDTEFMFAKLITKFPDRLFLVKSKPLNIDWINSNVSVDAWIVPWVGFEWASSLNKPFVLCLHDLVWLEFQDLYLRLFPFLHQEMNRLVGRIAGKAAAVVSQSNYVRTQHVEKYLHLPSHKTHVVRLAAPSEEYALFGIEDEDSFRERHSLYGNYMVYPTAIRAHKNHTTLIKGFIRFRQSMEGEHSDLRLVLTDHYLHNPLQEEIRVIIENCSSEIRDSIIFLNRLPSNDLPPLYRYAMGTLVPTLFEGSCPFPILESLISNTPVAVSNIEVTKEVIQDMDTMLEFDPYSEEEIEVAIYRLWKHGDSLLPKQKLSLENVLQRTWADVANEYYAVVQKVIESGG